MQARYIVAVAIVCACAPLLAKGDADSSTLAIASGGNFVEIEPGFVADTSVGQQGETVTVTKKGPSTFYAVFKPFRGNGHVVHMQGSLDPTSPDGPLGGVFSRLLSGPLSPTSIFSFLESQQQQAMSAMLQNQVYASAAGSRLFQAPEEQQQADVALLQASFLPRRPCPRHAAMRMAAMRKQVEADLAAELAAALDDLVSKPAPEEASSWPPVDTEVSFTEPEVTDEEAEAEASLHQAMDAALGRAEEQLLSHEDLLALPFKDSHEEEDSLGDHYDDSSDHKLESSPRSSRKQGLASSNSGLLAQDAQAEVEAEVEDASEGTSTEFYDEHGWDWYIPESDLFDIDRDVPFSFFDLWAAGADDGTWVGMVLYWVLLGGLLYTLLVLVARRRQAAAAAATDDGDLQQPLLVPAADLVAAAEIKGAALVTVGPASSQQGPALGPIVGYNPVYYERLQGN